jgi:hypothetical protein
MPLKAGSVADETAAVVNGDAETVEFPVSELYRHAGQRLSRGVVRAQGNVAPQVVGIVSFELNLEAACPNAVSRKELVTTEVRLEPPRSSA